MKSSPFVLIVNPNPKVPFVFEELAAMNARITVVHPPSMTWPAGVAGVVDAFPLDIFDDTERSLEHLERLHAQNPWDAVFPVFELALPFSARVAKRLGLRFASEETVLKARDKSVMRAAFRAAGMNVPNFARVESSAEAIAALANGLRFPLVVKPTTGFCSQGVIRADDEAALRAAVDAVVTINRERIDPVTPHEEEHRAAVIIEEFIEGPEWAAESYAQNGQVYVLGLGEKGNPTGPYFEERFYIMPGKALPEVQAACAEQIARGMLALGITDGPAHTELRIRDGVPYILEIGARLGGAGVSHFMAREACGRRLVRLVAENLLEGSADVANLTPEPRYVATSACWVVPVGACGTIERIEGLDEIRALPQTRHVIQWMYPGDVIESYPHFSGYPAFVLSQHPSYEDAAAYHQQLEALAKIVYRVPLAV